MADTTLPDLETLDTEALKALLIEQRRQYRALLSSKAQEIAHLKLVIEKLRRQVFGAKSEKISAQLDNWSCSSTSWRPRRRPRRSPRRRSKLP